MLGHRKKTSSCMDIAVELLVDDVRGYNNCDRENLRSARVKCGMACGLRMKDVPMFTKKI